MTEASAGKPAVDSRRIIERPRLTRLLSGSESRVLLLTAPAGYGKTTLAKEWVASAPGPHAWYQVTEASSDTAALALDLATALGPVVTEAGGQLRARLKSSSDPESQAPLLARDLAEDLGDWPEDAWLVIDDYHLLAGSKPAEDFVETLVAATTMRVLIATRQRPSWVSAKKLLYGEIAEFGRNILAMTPDEAALTLSGRRDDMPGLAALAEGWPAVIGLAVFIREPLRGPGSGVAEALHEFFAEELYQGLSEELKLRLAQLSVAPEIDEQVVQALLGERAQTTLEDGYLSGFLNKDRSSYDMHPLLREFLRMKLAEHGPKTTQETARIIGEAYADRQQWADAASMAAEFDLLGLMLRVLEEALESVLSEGRMSTLTRWLELAERAEPTSPIVRLARIEIAFRTGRWETARVQADQLARGIPEDHKLASRIYLRAGQIAHLDDRLDEALEWLTAAKAQARTPRDLRRCLWTRFVTLSDSEDKQATATALRELEATLPLDADDLLRANQSKLQFASRWGPLTEALDGLPDAEELATRSTDPIARTGFLQTYGTALSLSARYRESAEIAHRQIEEARRFGLEWVLPHGLEMRAIAQFGLRDFTGALQSLGEAQRLAKDQGNAHSQLNTLVIEARIHICRGAPERAIAALERRSSRLSNPGMEGDFLATQAFAFACSGLVPLALKALEDSEEVTNHLEARTLRAFTRAVIEDAGRESATLDRDLLDQALGVARETGNFDGFVLAYRGWPKILASLSSDRAANRVFVDLVRSLDRQLATRFGLRDQPRDQTQIHPLTPREREVFDLVRQGLSNREIARSLWISESTVKVHIRHVFEKLGAKSRTEAAALAPPAES